MAEAEAVMARERAAQLEAELNEEMHQIALQKEGMQRLERERHRARRRALSDATEKPSNEVMIESFDEEIETTGIRFQAVRLFHPRQGSCMIFDSESIVCLTLTISEWLGTTYSAEPICDNEDADLQLDLHVVVFESHYYSTNPGAGLLIILFFCHYIFII